MTVGSAPRLRHLPVRRVLVELPASADGVEVEPVGLPEAPRPAAWRRWGWLVALVPTIALLVYQRAAGGQDWPVPDVVVLVTSVGLIATALLALVRYQDDRAEIGSARGRRALLDAPVRATGTLTSRPAGRSRGTSADGATADGATTDAVLSLTPSSGAPIARPLRITLPPGVDGPRDGDPVAVWHAAADDDATGVLLVRYHRAWADDLLAALGPTDGPDDTGPTDSPAHPA
ncbi:hypothetical protein IF650_12925 [Cellulosimicrobium terreum]|nr:hypothetical protein [Cellulosimicrobium terreum]